MKPELPRLKKIILAISIVLIVGVMLCVAFVSPIVKYVIEKYDVQYTGRQIEMNWAYVNPFTGYVHLDGLRIFEAVKDTVFFSAEGVSAKFSLIKMLNKTYEITELTLDRPWGMVVQNQKKK